ncbi:AI-2E family transporter [Roseospira visakhapatnamensis]|uniref:Putative PurR-regulated permease PerM n=1 Tax=Roseospira visakhapatnamensis TaxID=390880 RepID=A0A7W6RAZ7_9PROT|nr:AI-2E family transporter [Roseospira visakhapatnamensis]MBB4265164.1 putative PurR-regulated permease PerM [Roseospira visakhapatnamensis]
MTTDSAFRSMIGLLWFGAAVLFGSLLVLGQTVLVPVAVAVIVWHLINALAGGIGQLPRVGARLPSWVCMTLALGIIGLLLYLFGRMASQNIAEVTDAAPMYQENLRRLLAEGSAALGLRQAIDLDDLLNQISIPDLVPQVAGAVSSLVGQAGLILVYVLFLLIEQRRFDRKLSALLPDPEQESWVRALLGRIQTDIQTYVWIKTLTSVLTGTISYAVLVAVGVDYAPFWAVVIFLLNYIPTIGSLLGVAFPAVLALVQFGTPAPFLIVVGVLGTVQVAIGNILEPRLMGQSLNMSPLVVILSLVVWGQIWGVVGMFLCVPLTGMIMIVLSYFPRTRWVAVLLSGDGRIHHD